MTAGQLAFGQGQCETLPGSVLFWIFNAKMIVFSLYECEEACNVNKSYIFLKIQGLFLFFADADCLKLFPQHVPTILRNLH